MIMCLSNKTLSNYLQAQYFIILHLLYTFKVNILIITVGLMLSLVILFFFNHRVTMVLMDVKESLVKPELR